MPMNPLNLQEVKATDLDVFANPADLRQDLQALADYARTHEIKRGYRDNRIPQAHQQRLIKLMSDPASAAKRDQFGEARWVEHLDAVCLSLKWVSYDTEGKYMGYSSSEPSFPDNFMQFDDRQHRNFLELPLQAQEERILDVHLKAGEGCESEFFRRGPLGRLDPFDSRGCATGVVPTIAFWKVRRHLLELLAQCPPGVWFSTASLVDHLRLHDSWFVIPKEIPDAVRKDSLRQGRYANNFVERKRGDWSDDNPILNKDPEGFAKVEGRFIERFLEGIPLVLGYTEAAYTRSKTETPIEPSRGLLPAFRITERLRRALCREIAGPKVTVLPNFEVHVESLFFPARTEAQLRPLGELVQRGIVTVFKLTKPKVAAALAAQADENAIETLKTLSGRELPPNVEHELRDWAGHSEKFILYEGFGVLEGRREAAGSDRFVVETISPNLALVHSAEALYRHLEAAEQVPLRIRHSENALSVPAHARSQMAPSAAPPSAPIKRPAKVKRSLRTTLWFADGEAHAAFCQLLLDAKCVVATDRRALTVSYPPQAEPQVKECLRKLKETYALAVEDIES
jgi:hypothetical protein